MLLGSDEDDDDVELRGLWTADLVRGMRKKQRKEGDAWTDCRVPLKEDVKLAQGKRRVIKLKRGQPDWRCHERLGWDWSS